MEKMAFIHQLSLIFLRLCVCWSAGILTQHSTTHILFSILHKKKSSAAPAHSPPWNTCDKPNHALVFIVLRRRSCI